MVGVILAMATVAVAAATFVTTWRYPRATSLALIFLLFTSLSDLLRVRTGPLSLNLVVVASSLTAILVRRRGVVGLKDPVLLSVLLYAVSMVVSGLTATDASAAVSAAIVQMRDFAALLLMLNLLPSVSASSTLRLANWTIVIAGSFLAIAALLGFFTGHKLLGLAIPYTGYIADGTSGARLAGQTGDPDIFAQILLLTFPFAMYRAWGERRPVLVALALAASAVLMLAIALTYSRGALIGLLVVLGIAVYRSRSKPVRLVQLVAVLGLSALMIPPQYWHRISATVAFLGTHPEFAAADESLFQRSELWRVGTLMFLQHPVNGVGMDNYGLRYADYYSQVDPGLPCCPMGAHNFAVRIAAETGLLGLLVFFAVLAFAVIGLRRTARLYRKLESAPVLSLIEPVEVAIYGYIGTAMFLDAQYMRAFWMILGLAAMTTRGLRCGTREPT